MEVIVENEITKEVSEISPEEEKAVETQPVEEVQDDTPVIELRGISKHFGEVRANKNINLTLKKGEILAILGENGSGKTTLMNMISGIYYPDEGQIFINGKEVQIRSPQDAFENHIGMIHQHFKLVDVFTAADNIILGDKILKVDNRKVLNSYFSDYRGSIASAKEVRDAALNAENPEARSRIYAKYLMKRQRAYLKVALKTAVMPMLRFWERNKFNYLARGRAEAIQHYIKKFGFDIDLSKKIYDMSVSEKQTVEIIKVLYRGANILILDEPTAVLTPQEIRKLFDVLRKMREDGKAIIIITHKLNEVMEISDRVSVLRKGEYIGTVNTAETNYKELTEMMVGKKVDLNIERKEPVNPKPRLIVNNLTILNSEGRKAIDDISFTVNGGEILGVAGIAGNGQKELLEGIAGLQRVEGGEIIFHNPKENRPVTFFHNDIKQIREKAEKGMFHYPDGTPVVLKGKSNGDIKKLVDNEQILYYEDEIINLRDKKPREIQELGIKLSFVPEDRLNMGLVGNMSIVDNMMLRSYRKGKTVFLNRKRPKNLADNIIDELEVVTPSDQTPVRRLSGGNVQKVLVGREISSSPKVLMAAYPVRGLDINSSYLIYNLLNKQKEKNVAVVFVGEDLDVLLALCDRILVLCGGKITGILDGKTAKKDEVGLLMTKHVGEDHDSTQENTEVEEVVENEIK